MAALHVFPPGFYVAAIVAILITGIAKSGFGTGSGGLAVPLMALYISPAEAAGIMLPILCAMDVFSVHAYRRSWSRRHLAIMLPGALLGIVVGALAFGLLPVDTIRLLLGVIAVLFALNRWLRLSERIAARLVTSSEPPGRVAGVVWGAVSGATSTLAHAGGPPFAVYMLAQRVDKTLFVGTSVVFFLVVNYAKLVPYWWLGQLNAANLATSLLFAPLVPVGVWLGLVLHRRMSDALFYQLSYGLLFATGVKLIYDAVA